MTTPTDKCQPPQRDYTGIWLMGDIARGTDAEITYLWLHPAKIRYDK